MFFRVAAVGGPVAAGRRLRLKMAGGANIIISMELFELVLLLLACVAASSVLDQVISKMSLPLLQIAVGFVAALAMPHLAEVHLDSELFLVLFIAPLLFREAKETDRLTLWGNKWSVISMAIALVIVSVIAAGFVLNAIIPAIALAAAFGCAAALGPTDAAAVAAMGSSIELSERQNILLSGEALINDASGVVAFQFAVAAALTGSFSASEAAGSFAVLFFGGIGAGIVMGAAAKTGMDLLRARGLVSTTLYVIYEVLSPFIFFLAAEEIHVSGILAVVAAGIVMQDHSEKLVSAEKARNEMVANSFWEVIIFLINGILFVMLGMQLPKVMDIDAMGGESAGTVICAMLAVTATIVVIRFLWLAAMELYRKDPETGVRGSAYPKKTIKAALVTTIAGPKCAVTLSIIMTLPLVMRDGSPFPQRDLIIFVTSGVILCTLLLADFALPRLAPIEVNECEQDRLDKAKIMVLEGVVKEMRRVLDEYAEAEFAPAMRLTLVRYRVRLMRQRFATDAHADIMVKLVEDVLDVQQERADEIQKDAEDLGIMTRMPYYLMLPGIRASVGYFAGGENVGARFETKKARFLFRLLRIKRNNIDDEQSARIYHDTCIFAIELERAAIDYLKTVRHQCDDTDACSIEDKLRADVADVLIEEHETALQSLWGRINFGQETKMDEDSELVHGIHTEMPEGMKNTATEQFRMARHYADEADANGLEMELDQIRRLRAEGKISEHDARTLREEVYLLQTTLME